MNLLNSFEKKMGTTFFVIAQLLPYLGYLVPRIDYSCGDGSCMAEGLMYQYGIYAVVLISYYASAIYFLKIKFNSYWQCALIAIPALLVVSPRGAFNNLF